MSSSSSSESSTDAAARVASPTPMTTSATTTNAREKTIVSWEEDRLWEGMAKTLVDLLHSDSPFTKDETQQQYLGANTGTRGQQEPYSDPTMLRIYVQYVTLLRVGIPSLAFAVVANLLYPFVAMVLAHNVIHDDAGVFAVVAQDASQYIQNILTTSGLTFGILVGQTYYFMYQQQEAIYLALFEEVTMAKSLLEQVALIGQGREILYQQLLQCVNVYVQDDLMKFATQDPAERISARPVDDPLEDILYYTSVGEPSLVYQTVRSLRQARASRLGALQQKLPSIHMVLLWSLAIIVLSSFPLLGAAVQTIGGPGILRVQAWYLSFIVFGITATMGVINELRKPAGTGAYNIVTVLTVMAAGLQEELHLRLEGKIGPQQAPSPSIDFYYKSNVTASSQSFTEPRQLAQDELD